MIRTTLSHHLHRRLQISSKPGPTKKRFVVLGFVAIVLVCAWWMCGYQSSSTILVKGYPVATTADKQGLIVATVGDHPRNIMVMPQLVTPLRVINFESGQETTLSLDLPETVEDELRNYANIESVSVSQDNRFIAAILQTDSYRFSLAVLDQADRKSFFYEGIGTKQPRFGHMPDTPVVAFPSVGSRIAFESVDETGASVVLWDIESEQQLAKLPNSELPAFSPDGTRLVTVNYQLNSSLYTIPEHHDQEPFGIKIWDVASEPKAQSVMIDGGRKGWEMRPPQFSPKGDKIVLGVRRTHKGNYVDTVEVVDITSGKISDQEKGWSPYWFANGNLAFIRKSDVRSKFHKYGTADIVIVNMNDSARNEVSVHYDLGASDYRGPIYPRPQLTKNGSKLVVMYHTRNDFWDVSPISASSAFQKVSNVLRINAPRGIGVDLIDQDSGGVDTYHLGPDPFGLYRHLHGADRIVMPDAGNVRTEAGKYYVYNIPPQRTYRFFFLTLGGIAAAYLVAGALRRRRNGKLEPEDTLTNMA